MKEGWEVKKLGDVCEIYQPKTISTSSLVENGKYLVYGANGIIGKYDQYNHIESELLMTCRGATCGTINISEPYSWINGNAMVIHPIEGNIIMPYLKYVLSGIDLSNVITGAAQPQITRQSLSPLLIPIPPLPEQSKIVEELDQLSNIIEKKRQQLSELDNLAQSIFYDMFGDPVTNEKGWEVKKLGDIAYIGLGFTHTPEYVDEGIPFLSVKDITKGEICWDKIKFVSKEEYESAPRGAKPNKGDILFCRVGTMGKPVIIKTDKPFCTFVSLGYLHLLNNEIVNIYVKYWMLSYAFDAQVEANVKGLAIKNLNTGWLKTFDIQIPSFQLQQLFAQKIEAIEKEKELIKQSIKETEELFNSRMDYYFG